MHIVRIWYWDRDQAMRKERLWTKAIFSEFTIGHNAFSFECLLCSGEKFT